VTNPYWPFSGLTLTTADLELRPMREADVAVLADVLPSDIDLDPSLPAYRGIEPRVARGIALHQGYWRALGGWRPGSWHLPFVVRLRSGEVIGAQDLEGPDFAERRTVETSSYLVTAARGRGFGKQMRRAVLALAFEHIGALAAETEAWHDNAASLGVSRAVGYLPNGERFHPRGDGVDVMIRMRHTRERWLASPGHGVVITGFDACRPLFGIRSDG
jgi:RimJ/RimL family protein N-acetyltransferase